MADMQEPVPPAPIVVNLGKESKKKLKKLKKGQGPLVDDVMQAMAQVRQGLGPEDAGKTLLPVVVIFSRKRKKNPLGLPLGR